LDLVITDQLMPGMTGTQLVEAIRSEWPDMPAILATGYSELPAGVTPNVDRLAKPFTQADLAQAISTTVARPDEGRVVPFRRG
jgi:CheY-like chemotaxis protein